VIREDASIIGLCKILIKIFKKNVILYQKMVLFFYLIVPCNWSIENCMGLIACYIEIAWGRAGQYWNLLGDTILS